MTAAYEGFTGKQKLLVVGSAIVAVLLSLIFAAWIMRDAQHNTQFSQRDQEVVNQLLGDTRDPQHKSMLRAQAIDAVANLKQLANRQSMLIVAFAGAFALCAIGFALFLLGADGAFQIQAEQGKGGIKLLLASTTPGIVCFVLAVALMGMAIAYRSSTNAAPGNFSKQVMGTLENSLPRAPAGADIASNTASDEKAKEVAAQQKAIQIQEAEERAAEKAAAAKLAAEQAIAKKVAAAKAAADMAEAQKLAADKLMAVEVAAAKAAATASAAAKVAAEKLAAEKVASARLAAQKSAADKLAAEKAAAAKLTAEKNSAAKSEAERVSAGRLAADRAAADRFAADRALVERAKLATERAAADKRFADRAGSNNLAADKASSEKARAERAAADRVDIANLTAERIAAASEPSEIYKRAVALRMEGDIVQALALLRYASSNGHGPSSRLLAAIYRDGAPDVRANFRQAERYQALADAQGSR